MAALTWWKSLFRKKSYPFLLGIVVGTGIKEVLEQAYEDFFPRYISADVSQNGKHILNLPTAASHRSKTGTKIICDDGAVINSGYQTNNGDISGDLTTFETTYGLPLSSSIIKYSNHALHYDNSKKIPSWVVEHLSKDKLYGKSDRSACSFKEDKNVPEKFRSKNEDYFSSQYARGHMMPAADAKFDQGSMSDTFYLSNIVPQNYENNGGFWYRMELYCRSLAKRYSDVYIISGPLFKPSNAKEHRVTYQVRTACDVLHGRIAISERLPQCPGKGTSLDVDVKNQVIGDNHVAVPTHLYKIILIDDKKKGRAVGAFVVPNEKIENQKQLTNFQVSVDEIEQWSGHEFLPKIKKRKLKDLCTVDSCKLKSQKVVEFYNLSRSIKYAKSLEDLEKIWKTVNEKEMQVDKQFMDEFTTKQKELKQNRNGF